MKIVTIFDGRLYSSRYDDQVHEYRRLIDLWNDDEYLEDFYHTNISVFNRYEFHKGHSLEKFIKGVWNDLDMLEDLLDEIENDNTIELETFFRQLHNNEYPPIRLSYQKRQFKYLRLYAIRVDENMFLITGGAIKITETMNQHKDTIEELHKLNVCKRFLESQDVFDCDSFLEFVAE